MTDDSIGGFDEIMALSYMKVAASVEGINRNKVKKEVNRWVDTKEEV